MSWALPLVDARLNLIGVGAVPLVSERAFAYSKTWLVPSSTTQMLFEAPVGSIVRPVGVALVDARVQLPSDVRPVALPELSSVMVYWTPGVRPVKL